jgi:acyl-CoA thioesterase FadM
MSLERMGKTSVTFAYQISRQPDGQPAARGKVVCAVTDLESFRAVEVPQSLRTLFLELG